MMNMMNMTRVLTALLLLMLGASTGWAQNNETNDGTAIATLEEFEGSVSVERLGQSMAAEVGMRLERDDVVITRADSRAVIRFDYGCVIRLPENQRLTIRDGAMCCVDDEKNDEEDSDGEEDSDDALARLSGPRGTVTVRREAEDLPGEHDMALFSGDRILTGDQSEVTIAYERGCDVRLGSNQQYDVLFAEECCLSMLLICVAGTPAGVVPLAVVPPAIVPAIVVPPIASIITDDDDGPVRPISPE